MCVGASWHRFPAALGVNWQTLLLVGLGTAGFLCHEKPGVVALRLLLAFGWSYPGLVVWGAAGSKGTSEEEVNGSERDETLWPEFRSQ